MGKGFLACWDDTKSWSYHPIGTTRTVTSGDAHIKRYVYLHMGTHAVILKLFISETKQPSKIAQCWREWYWRTVRLHHCVSSQVLVGQSRVTRKQQRSGWAAWLSPSIFIMFSPSALPPCNEGVYLVDLCFLDPFLEQLLHKALCPGLQSWLESSLGRLETVLLKLGGCPPMSKRLASWLSSDCEWMVPPHSEWLSLS